MKQLLQRRPLGVPLHESAAVMAFSFLVASLILDLLAWAGAARDTTGTNVGAYAILFAALIATVLAVLAALAAAKSAQRRRRTRRSRPANETVSAAAPSRCVPRRLGDRVGWRFAL